MQTLGEARLAHLLSSPCSTRQLWPAQLLRNTPKCRCKASASQQQQPGQQCPTRQAVAALQPLLADTAHMYISHTAARLQGVQVPDSYADVHVCVQWDQLQVGTCVGWYRSSPSCECTGMCVI